MSGFYFEPIAVNESAPGGACFLRTFSDIGAFTLKNVDVSHRRSPNWVIVRRNLVRAQQSGVRCAEVH